MMHMHLILALVLVSSSRYHQANFDIKTHLNVKIWMTQDIKGTYPPPVSVTPQSEPPVACWFLLTLRSPPQTEE